MAKADNKDLKEKLKKIIDDARNKQAEVNADGSTKYNSYEILSSIDVNDFISKNYKQLSYLSWADALHIVKHLYPQIKYNIVKHNTFTQDIHGNLHATILPYMYDHLVGYYVEVEVTIDDRTESCMLPVYDSGYNAKKATAYVNGKKDVEAVNMGDINYAHQRCLVKCLGLHGLGDYLYRGESLPSGTAESEMELSPQYVRDEVILLANEIKGKMKLMYEVDELGKPKTTKNDKGESVIVYTKEYREVNRLSPNKKLVEQFESGGCNIEYTKHLINMAMALNIEVGQFIKTTPEVK